MRGTFLPMCGSHRLPSTTEATSMYLANFSQRDGAPFTMACSSPTTHFIDNCFQAYKTMSTARARLDVDNFRRKRIYIVRVLLSEKVRGESCRSWMHGGSRQDVRVASRRRCAHFPMTSTSFRPRYRPLSILALLDVFSAAAHPAEPKRYLIGYQHVY